MPKSQPRVVILGSGQMGLVCATMLRPGEGRKADPEVVIWGHDPQEVAELAQTRATDRLAGYQLPEGVQVTGELGPALEGADLVVSAIPAQHVRDVWSQVAGLGLRGGVSAVSVSKGIETGTLMTPTQVIADALGDDLDTTPRRLASLSGPTIAAELARCLPATMVAATDPTSDTEDGDGFAGELQALFSTSWLRIYTNTDLLGVELAGAVKNVVAIAAGILDGLGAGYNAKSALLARGLAEIARLGTAMGARHETFFGVAGAGDLATTCFSPEGRNRSCGEALGKGQSLPEYLEQSRSIVEGVATTKGVVELSRKYRVDMPITLAVHAVLFEGLDPVEAITKLMSRELKAERVR